MSHDNRELPINFQFKCNTEPYLVVVRQFLFGQWRIQLCKGNEEHIVRECCTYLRTGAVAVKDGLFAADNPEEYLEALAKPWNCEYKGGRIRLDNTDSKEKGAL